MASSLWVVEYSQSILNQKKSQSREAKLNEMMLLSHGCCFDVGWLGRREIKIFRRIYVMVFCSRDKTETFILLQRLLQPGAAMALACLRLMQDIRTLRHHLHLMFGTRERREELVCGLTVWGEVQDDN